MQIIKHGHAKRKSKSPTYLAWTRMRSRTKASANPRHRRLYYESGIGVCPEWASYPTFLSDMGEVPDGLTLERVDNTKGYSPENCIWDTQKNQKRNTRTNRMLTLGNRTQCLGAWAEESGLKEATIRRRLSAGWTIGNALTVPVQSFGARNPEWRTSNGQT